MADQKTTRYHEANTTNSQDKQTVEKELADTYSDVIDIHIDELPGLQPQVLPTRQQNPWRRFLAAGRRRSFTLVRDFSMTLNGEALLSKLRGTVIIPRESDGKSNVFDGASIPLPWVVSYLSFGVIRPLGIFLVASVAHDFAFKHGYLPIHANNKIRHIPIARHEADDLFRQITMTVNNTPFFSQLAWHAVRLGWWFIPYAGQYRTGEKPVKSTILAALAVVIATVGVVVLNGTVFAELNGIGLPMAIFGLIATIMGVVYLWIAITTKLEPSFT